MNPTQRTGLRRALRTLRARPRLLLSIGLGAAVGLILPGDLRSPTRLLIGWDVGTTLYLILALVMMGRSDVTHIRRRAILQDEGRFVILTLVAGAALASLFAILAELGGAQGANREPSHLMLAAFTILVSWAFTHVMFALHYAHEYYVGNSGKCGGLSFPGEGMPDYWDFLYFSFVIGMTSQVSDVAVTSRNIRRTVTAHGVVSFIFNATLLALTVNIAAGAL
jgi:uncharacterized membrane protein